MKTKVALGMAALALSLVAANSLKPAFAYRGDPNVKGPNFSEQRHQLNMTALEKGDYKAWVANMNGRGATRFVNEANFQEFAKAQLAAQRGDRSALDAFRAKYGLGQRNGQGHGQGRAFQPAR